MSWIRNITVFSFWFVQNIEFLYTFFRGKKPINGAGNVELKSQPNPNQSDWMIVVNLKQTFIKTQIWIFGNRPIWMVLILKNETINNYHTTTQLSVELIEKFVYRFFWCDGSDLFICLFSQLLESIIQCKRKKKLIIYQHIKILFLSILSSIQTEIVI